MKFALYILIISISFTLINAQSSVFIKNVPDYSQPPDSTIPSSIDTTNYCAPYAFLNIVEYWDSVQVQPFARGLMGGLLGKDIVEYIGWFMDTNNQGSPARENDNGRPASKGTYIMDQWHGAEEFLAFDAGNTFQFPYPIPPQKNAYGWGILHNPGSDFYMFKDEIDRGNPVKLDFKYWNISPTGGFIHDPGLSEDTIFVYDWGPEVEQSGTLDERDPLEFWNLKEGDDGIGHAVTAVGYLENYAMPDTHYVIVHDNWANTRENITVPWLDSKINAWFSFQPPEPPDLAVTQIRTANDTALGFTDSLQIHKPVTVAATIQNQGNGSAGYYICTTSVLDPHGSPVITLKKHLHTMLNPQESINVYFDSLFTPSLTGGYDISSTVYWDMNGDSLENDSPEPNLTNNTLAINAQVYIRTNLPINVPDDFATIQAAIDASSDGNTVLVDDGTYYENINFKGKAITVASHFYLDGETSHISKTIIDGGHHTNPDSGSVVYFISGEDTNSVLFGFTITGGRGTAYQFGGYNPERDGGGIFIRQSGAKILNNYIINNSISVTGDTASGGAGIIVWCENDDNVIVKSNIIMNNSIKSAYWAFGAGVWINSKGSVLIEGNEFIANKVEGYTYGLGSGLFVDGIGGYSGKSIIQRNLIKDNITQATTVQRALGGGIWIRNVSPDIINNIIVGNRAEYGGGIGVEYWDGYGSVAKPLIINNTITNNTADYGGALEVFGTDAFPIVINSILWGNTAEQNNEEIILLGNGEASVIYSDVQGGWDGEGNIDKNPAFEDSLFRLSDSSWCVGNGVDSIEINHVWYKSPSWDYFGNPRPNPVDPSVDMGAIESPYDSVAIVGLEGQKEIVSLKFALFQNYPNPFNPKTTIKYTVGANGHSPLQHVDLSIYNILGQKVATLVNKKQPVGQYSVEWDAFDFPSGVYIYRLKTEVFDKSNKMILLK